MLATSGNTQELTFLELRRKVQHSELLSAAVERLLRMVGFTGRISVVVQNGRVLKCGYEEGYFSQRPQLRLLERACSPGGNDSNQS